MRETQGRGVARLNPADARQFPDGTYGGRPVIADETIPEGFAQFGIELPPGLVAAGGLLCLDDSAAEPDGEG